MAAGNLVAAIGSRAAPNAIKCHIEILILCTGNICRSPVAERLLGRELDRAGVTATVSSAGLVGAGQPASAHSVELLARMGIDLSSHSSRTLHPGLLDHVDLVLGMARSHVREAVAMAPAKLGRAFTLKELVRRAEIIGPRTPGEPLSDWLARAQEGRAVHDLLGDAAEDDVADPIGRPRRAYERMVNEINELTAQLVSRAWPNGGSR